MGSSSTSDNDETAGAPSSTASTESTGDAPGDLPAACEGLSSPFVSADCLSGLRDRCRALTDDASCEASPSLTFDGGFAIACGWAKVVTFSDIASCTIASVEGRCEAGIEQFIGCGDKCTDEPDLYSSLRANVIEAELIEMPCAPEGRTLDGPLGPSSAIGAPPGETGACAPNITPPAPAICDCAPVACTAG